MHQQEILLTGGKTNLGSIVRVGDTVRRPLNTNSTFVHKFLQYLENINFDASPRFLGIDEKGREIISYIEGDVPSNLGYYSDEQLIVAAKLIRRFHDATQGCSLANNEEIICHNDLSPCNFVFIDNMPTSIIDFEMAAPGTRIFDLAYAESQKKTHKRRKSGGSKKSGGRQKGKVNPAEAQVPLEREGMNVT